MPMYKLGLGSQLGSASPGCAAMASKAAIAARALRILSSTVHDAAALLLQFERQSIDGLAEASDSDDGGAEHKGSQGHGVAPFGAILFFVWG